MEHSEKEIMIAICGDHGPYEAVTNKYGSNRTFTTTCPVCLTVKQKREEELKRTKEAAQWRKDRIENLKKNANLPYRFVDSSFDNYITEYDGQIRALDECRKFVDRYFDDDCGGLLLLGRYGTGKTHLATAICNALMSDGVSARYVTVRDLIRRVRETWRHGGNESEADVLRKFTDCGLLVIDEVGVQSGTDSERNTLFDVIDTRYGRNLPTVVISNFDIAGVEDAIGERALDRLREGGKAIIFDWRSFRAANTTKKVVQSKCESSTAR